MTAGFENGDVEAGCREDACGRAPAGTGADNADVTGERRVAVEAEGQDFLGRSVRGCAERAGIMEFCPHWTGRIRRAGKRSVEVRHGFAERLKSGATLRQRAVAPGEKDFSPSFEREIAEAREPPGSKQAVQPRIPKGKKLKKPETSGVAGIGGKGIEDCLRHAERRGRRPAIAAGRERIADGSESALLARIELHGGGEV